MFYYILILLLILTCFKSESFNQSYIHGQTLSNNNKTITDEDVIENPSNSDEYSPKLYFNYIFKPSIHIDSLEVILKSISNPDINLIDLKHKNLKPFYKFSEINRFLENKINNLSGPLGVFKILDNVGHINKGLDVDYMKITFNLYNISRSSATPVICYLYKTEGQYIIKEIKFNFIKQPENIMSKQVDIKTDNYDDITYPASLKNKITENIIEEDKLTKEYKIKDKYMSQDNIINDSLEYNTINKTSDIQGVLQRWYNKQ
mgnify:FL=1|jgi:hypothetical protein